MPFRFGDVWKRRDAIGNWRLPGEPAFANSRAFELLSRDLKRYVLDEVAGRSFLIAGHRGAGKTSTVTHAIRRLRSDILSASVDPDRLPTGRRGRLQRPMMVKLVGQALLAEPPRIKEIENLQDAPADEEEGEDSDPADPPAPGEDEGEAGEGKPEKGDTAGNALVHITIALYRALAAEIAEGFAVHALEGDPNSRADRLELAAQLALELDGTPEPAGLRAFWNRIGRLQHGVLWPPDSDRALMEGVILDQGLKEVVAVSTAAQAFQVCSGAVHYSVSRHQIDKRKSKTDAGLDVKDLVSRLGALGAGAVAGSIVGVEQGGVPGVGVGLAVWLLGTLTLSWSGSRERRSDRTLNYQFLQDRSIQTLDRDLPVVIDRIRHAGLAPVFVIDELDKLIETEPGEKIAEIIRRLKHLVADYGFFCFLTDRKYFDRVEGIVTKEAYPTEHTYFSERVLVLSRAEDLYLYLLGLLEDVAEDGPQALQAAVFALVVMYRSKMNFSDVARQVAILTGPEDELICTEAELLAPGRYRLAATIQIAIDRILGSEEMKQRMDVDSAFAQLAIDALYYVPRAWESDRDGGVDISPRTLRDDLLNRMGAPKAPVPEQRPADPFPGPEEKCAISATDLRDVLAMVARLISYLGNFQMLYDELKSEAGRTSKSADAALLTRLADIVVIEKTAMLRPAGSHAPFRYNFILDELAGQVTPPEPPAPPPPPVDHVPARPRKTSRSRRPKAIAPARTAEQDRPTADQAAAPAVPPAAAGEGQGPELPPTDPRLAELTPFFEAIGKLLAASGISIDDLGANGLLPSTASQSLFDTARNDLDVATRNPAQSDAAERAINAYLTFVRALDDRGTEVAQALVLLARTRADSGKPDPAPRILARLARYFEPSVPFIVPPPLRLMEPWVFLAGNAASIESFLTEMELWRPKENYDPWSQLKLRDAAYWAHWRSEVETLLLSGPPAAPNPVRYVDAVTAAADLPPGKLFRLNLARMDAVDWSRVALTGVPLPNRNTPAPIWPLFAGLAALKVNQSVLSEVRSTLLSGGSTIPVDERGFIDQLISRAPFSIPAMLHVLPDQPGRRTLPVSDTQPVLAIGTSEFPSYVDALNWLAELDIFEGAVRELD
ncbi:MAG TPA: hypothetical protein VIT45_18340 [Allosphingosinicella sp.]